MQPKPHPVLHTYFLDADTNDVYHIMGPLTVKLTMLPDDSGLEYFRCVWEDPESIPKSIREYKADFIKECFGGK
jgi:hypothetical protein